MSQTPVKRKEIYKYEAPWTLYGMNWSIRPDKRFRLALGSFVEEYNNKVQIVMLDEDNSEFTSRSTFDHPYPTTKIMWIPDTVTIAFFLPIFSSKLSYTLCFVNLIERNLSRSFSDQWWLFTRMEMRLGDRDSFGNIAEQCS
jgi:hypothetical protein